MAKLYDYIIAGGGCAGLSLAYKMFLDPYFNDKTILVLERESKEKNDRTWCHWSTDDSIFDEIVLKSWKEITVHDYSQDLKRSIAPYTYKMIKGIDFYNYIIPKLETAVNISFRTATIENIIEEEAHVKVSTPSEVFIGKQVFKSFIDLPEKIQDHWVLQHFKGYFIKTESDYFDDDQIRFMDFRTPQNDEVRFFYVLPTSKKTALVELAIFSAAMLSSKDYDVIIKDYIKTFLPGLNYSIEEEELGAIPMTTYNFGRHDTDKVINIGTSGGSVKASSGFAFERIQDHTDAIINLIKENKNPIKAKEIFKPRFKFYDKIFMNVLLTGKEQGSQVFMDMFEKLPVPLVYKFLDGDTSFLEETKLFTAPPTLSFMKAFFEELV